MAGKFKIMRDGSPYYCAEWVKDLSPAARDMMFRGSNLAGGGAHLNNFKDLWPGGASKIQRAAWAAIRHPETTYTENPPCPAT